MPDDLIEQSTTNISDDDELLNSEETPEKAEKAEKAEKKPEKKESKEKSEESESEDKDEKDEKDEDEAQAESESETDPEKEEIPLHDRPAAKQLEKKFPNIFKEFPQLRGMIYREREYAQLFGTLADAKGIKENSAAFETLRGSISDGDSESLLSAIKESDEKQLINFSSNLMSTLHKVSPEAHWAAVVPVVENILRNSFAQGSRVKDENLQNAALVLSEYLLGDASVAEGKKSFVKAPESKKDEIQEERRKFSQERQQEFQSDVNNSTISELTSLVEGKFTDKSGEEKSRINPDGSFSKFIVDSLSDRIMKEVGRQMLADSAHMGYMNSLWDRAEKNGWRKQDQDLIKSAYLARARQLTPSIRTRFIAEVNGSNSKTAANLREKSDKAASRREGSVSGKSSSGSNNGSLDPKRIDWSNTSDEDLLADDDSRVKYRN